MSNELNRQLEGSLALVEKPTPSLIAPVMNVALARERLLQFQQFVKEYLVEGEDFGTIPGTPKPTLYKPGADKLCELYGLADEYEVTQRTEDFERGLFDYEVKCVLVRKPDMLLVSTGLGSCNSFESKYRWRDAKRLCPACGKEAIIKGKEEYGGGWLCFAKKGGCGAKFPDGDPAIVGQSVGKVQNEDIADIKNTILKMAKKRAKIDATLSATRSSGIFTQDMEDWDIPKAPIETKAPVPTSQHDNFDGGKPAAAYERQEPRVMSHPENAPRPTTTQQSAQQVTQRAATSPAAAQPQGAQLKFIPPNGLTCVVKGVKEIEGQPASEGKRAIRPYLIIMFLGMHNGCNFAYCFDTKFWELIRASVGLECHFQIKERDKDGAHFINIEDCIYVDGQEYIEGKPVSEGVPQ